MHDRKVWTASDVWMMRTLDSVIWRLTLLSGRNALTYTGTKMTDILGGGSV